MEKWYDYRSLYETSLYKNLNSIEEETIKVGRNICKTIFKISHLL